MAKKATLWATIKLKDDGFSSGVKNSASGLGVFKKNSDSATGSSKKLHRQNKNTESSFKTLAKKVTGVATAYFSVNKAISFGKECIDLANEQTSAEKRLETTMMNVAGTTLENVSAVKKYASELQGVTTVGDEVTIRGASQLATFQLQHDTIKTLLPSLQDLAVSQYGVSVTSDQMQSMSNLLGKVMTGNVSALTRYGVIMDDTQKKILQTGSESQRAAMLTEVLKQNFGGLSQAMANTPEGRIQQLKNAWGDMQEVVGAKLYPAITEFLGFTASKIPSIQGMITSAIETTAPIFTNLKEIMVSGFNKISDAITLVVDNWGWLSPVIAGVTGAVIAYNTAIGITNGLQKVVSLTTGMSAAQMGTMTVAELAHAAAAGVASVATTAFGAAMAFLTSPIFLVVAAIGAAIAIGVLLWKNWDTIKAKAIEWGGAIKTTVSDWVESAKAKLSDLWTNVKEFFGKIRDFITGVWDKVGGIFEKLFGTKDAEVNATVNVRNSGGVVDVVPHAKGGILTRPTLLGVSGMTAHIGGEAGAEAILPLSQFWRNLEKYIRSSNSGQQSVNNTIKIYVKSENADDEAIARTIAKKVKAALNNM